MKFCPRNSILHLAVWFVLFLVSPTAFAVPPLRIPGSKYQDKVYASWLGQCAGNMYGLAHEQKYFQEPGPDKFPLGYSGWGAARMKELSGAFSDDDTDIEYMYLFAMEQYGIEPGYSQLAEFWRNHVHREVWLANRAALAAMNYGLEPPWTGMKSHNPHWFQIDPQLVNEIWAVTAPGMVRYAVGKSCWAAKIMSDDWALQPTIFYAAMYAAAFFETDIGKLIETGKGALPPGARFARTIEDMKALYLKYPGDWKAARQEAVRECYLEEPASTRTATNANINAAFAVLALLYGQGDFQRTLDLACALGFDADNQAATLCGLLGILHGTAGIPYDLLFPYPELGWKEPFNDRYKNVTRDGLPDASLKDIARRLSLQGEQVILRHGGRRAGAGYEIAPDAVFTEPFEFPAGPMLEIETGQPVTDDFVAMGAQSPVWKVTQGRIPKGLRFSGGRISGTTMAPGVFPVTIEVRSGAARLHRNIPLLVRGRNLAPQASRILTPVQAPDLELAKRLFLDTPPLRFASSPEVLRDGKHSGDGATFLSIGEGSAPRSDFYGYEWPSPQHIGLVAFCTGFMEETSGWFTDLIVEYQDSRGVWQPAKNLFIDPPFPSGEGPYNKAHFAEYLLFFDPVETRAIRIRGNVGFAGVAAKNPPRFTSISELAVYEPVPGIQNLRRTSTLK